MKEFLLKALRWIAIPLVFLLSIVLANILGKILFNWIYADTGLFFFKNKAVIDAIDAMRELMSYMFGSGLSMMMVALVAPSHKVGTARTVGIVYAIVVSLVALLCIVTGQEIEMESYAGWIGTILGVIGGWFIVGDKNNL